MVVRGGGGGGGGRGDGGVVDGKRSGPVVYNLPSILVSGSHN